MLLLLLLIEGGQIDRIQGHGVSIIVESLLHDLINDLNQIRYNLELFAQLHSQVFVERREQEQNTHVEQHDVDFRQLRILVAERIDRIELLQVDGDRFGHAVSNVELLYELAVVDQVRKGLERTQRHQVQLVVVVREGAVVAAHHQIRFAVRLGQNEQVGDLLNQIEQILDLEHVDDGLVATEQPNGVHARHDQVSVRGELGRVVGRETRVRVVRESHHVGPTRGRIRVQRLRESSVEHVAVLAARVRLVPELKRVLVVIDELRD